MCVTVFKFLLAVRQDGLWPGLSVLIVCSPYFVAAVLRFCLHLAKKPVLPPDGSSSQPSRPGAPFNPAHPVVLLLACRADGLNQLTWTATFWPLWCIFGLLVLASIAATALADSAGWSDAGRYETIAFADVNGDGKADPCARGDEGYTCWPTAGASVGAAESVDEFSDAQGWDDVTYFGSLRLAGPSAKRVAPPVDAGAPDAGTSSVDAGAVAPKEESGGCGCRLAGPAQTKSAAIAWIAALSLMVMRRRRSRGAGAQSA